MNGAFIERNAGIGSDFFALNMRLSRTFRLGGAFDRGLVEAFNLTNRRNDLTRNTNFGSGAYPTNPRRRSGRSRRWATPELFKQPYA